MERLWCRAAVACAVLASVSLVMPAAGLGAGQSLPITQRVLRKGEFPGYAPGAVRVITSPVTWAQNNAFAPAAVLRKVGFVAAAVANLRATHRPVYATSASSTVVEFRSHRGALKYLFVFVTDFLRASGAKRFAVRSIPGAFGIANVSSAGGTYDVVFAQGRFFYDVMANKNDPTEPPSSSQVVSAAIRLYGRVHD